MTKQRLWILAVAALLGAAGLAQAAIAEGSVDADTAIATTAAAEPSRNLVGVDIVEAGDGGATVILETDGRVEVESRVLQDPDRLVLDLHGTVSRLDQRSYLVGGGPVARVRAGQFELDPAPVSRVVFDLDAPIAADVRATDDGVVVSFAAGTTPVLAAEPVAEPRPAARSGAEEPTGRAVAVEAIEDLLGRGTELAAPAPASSMAPAQSAPASGFETKQISSGEVQYTGKRISLNLVDADIKQLFRLFHDVSGLNFVLDPSVDGRVTVVLDNVPWDQALDLVLKNNGLDKVLENNVIRIAPTQKLAQEAAQRKALKEAKELEVEPITITRTLSYAKAEDVEEVIREGGILSPRGKVIVDDRTNTLIISDIPKKVQPLDTLISTLDTETPQVMIEARIVETTRQFTQDLGVVWGFSAIADSSRGTQTGIAFPYNARADYSLNLPGDGTASNLAFKFGNILDSFTLDVALNTLETDGRGRVLSSPKIATQNNEAAEIEQGVRIPVVNTTATEINVEFVSASLRMEVTPQITAEGTIILDVTVENNSPDFQNTVGDVPPINTQRAQTKVLIADGGTTVIGGIFTVNEGTSEVGVPWFRKIPGLGWLFKSTNVTQQNRELLIFITPRILKVG